jgi:hypothetical protein
MCDALRSSRGFRTFHVIDELNREGQRIEVDTSLAATQVIRALNELLQVRGYRSSWITGPNPSHMPWRTGLNPKALH